MKFRDYKAEAFEIFRMIVFTFATVIYFFALFLFC